MTVYVTADELLDIEHARLTLRRSGLSVDRGRLVREAVALVLADLEQNGDDSVDRAAPDAGMTAGLVASTGAGPEAAPAFAVRLDNFEGPFDLLLSLISKHKLDITEVALSKVTDEFIGFIKLAGPDWDLEQTSSFLLVAATLLDLKAARLLPQGDVEDEEDLALLEARDLLFARLLQYRAFKQVASVLETRMAGEARRYPRAVGLEERFATLLPGGADRARAGGVRRRWRPRRWRPSRSSRSTSRTSTRPPSASASRPPWWSTGCAGRAR